MTQPVSAASLPLPTGASSAANQSTIITALGNLLTELQAKADLTETQPVEITDGTDTLGVYKEGDSLGAAPAGFVLMAESPTGTAKPVQMGALNYLKTEINGSLPSGTARIGCRVIRRSFTRTISLVLHELLPIHRLYPGRFLPYDG